MTRHETSVPRSPCRLLAIVWLLSALVVALPAWLLVALSEGSGGRLAGTALGTASALAAVTGVAMGTVGQRLLSLSLWMSALLVAAGGAAVAGVAYDGRVFIRDALLVGGIPVVAGAVTALTAALRLRRSSAGHPL